MDDYDSQNQQLLEKLNRLREGIPETPLEAEKKAMEIGLIEEQLADLYEKKGYSPAALCNQDLEELTEQIKSISDELMQIEITMLKADMGDDEGERVKLQLSANALKSRRQALMDQVREMDASSNRPSGSDLEERVSRLEKEVEDIKALLYRTLTR